MNVTDFFSFRVSKLCRDYLRPPAPGFLDATRLHWTPGVVAPRPPIVARSNSVVTRGRGPCLARRGAALAVAPPAYSQKARPAKWQAASCGLAQRPEYLHESWTHKARSFNSGPAQSAGGSAGTGMVLDYGPAVQEEARNAPAGHKAKLKSGKKRILAVDDLAVNTRLVKLYLEQTNEYVVREENNPKTAISAAEEFQPDLILLDVMMPGLDGGDLALLFHANPELAGVPIVFLTAAVTKGEVEADGGRIGGNTFLAKPIVLAELVACIRHHLGA